MSKVYKLLQLNRLIKNNRLKLLLLYLAQLMNRRYYSVRIDPIYACNLRCRMCYFSGERKQSAAQLSPAEIDLVAKAYFGNAIQVAIGCGAEPTLAKNYLSLAAKAKEMGVPHISLVTNGQLITQQQLQSIDSIGIDELIISVHGTKQSSYEHFMTGAKWDKLMELLTMFTQIASNKTQLRINYTANPENIDELTDFFEVFGKFNISTLQVRPIMSIGGEFTHGFSSADFEKYSRVIYTLKEQCRCRKVKLLANINNPTYEGKNTSEPIIGEVYRYVSPAENDINGFNWRNETYRQFQKRTRWRRNIIRQAFGRTKPDSNSGFAEKYSGQYDIM